jgi:hypothetical protein
MNDGHISWFLPVVVETNSAEQCLERSITGACRLPEPDDDAARFSVDFGYGLNLASLL